MIDFLKNGILRCCCEAHVGDCPVAMAAGLPLQIAVAVGPDLLELREARVGPRDGILLLFWVGVG